MDLKPIEVGKSASLAAVSLILIEVIASTIFGVGFVVVSAATNWIQHGEFIAALVDSVVWVNSMVLFFEVATSLFIPIEIYIATGVAYLIATGLVWVIARRLDFRPSHIVKGGSS